MSSVAMTTIEKAFLSLPQAERETIIRHGVAFRMADLRKRLFLAESKVRHFEEQYQTTLEHLDTAGLPDDASYEMHEEYILWHHWATVVQKVTQEIDSLQDIARQGLQGGAVANAGD